MVKVKKYRVGDKLIERGKVYRIFKIENRKKDGSAERIIHYCPYFKNSINKTLVCSIPEGSLLNSGIRKPLTKKEIRELMSDLSRRTRKSKELNIDQAKATLNLNDIHKTAEILRKYWRERDRNIENFTKTKKDVLNLAMTRLVEEIALAMEIKPVDAEERITATLGN